MEITPKEAAMFIKLMESAHFPGDQLFAWATLKEKLVIFVSDTEVHDEVVDGV